MFIKIIILGIVQGLTEFLPVSSSGHLVILEYFLGLKQPGILLETFMHLGTLTAVIVFFYQDIIKLFHFGKAYSKNMSILSIWIFIILATLLTSIIALLLEKLILNAYESVLIVIVLLFFNSLILIFTGIIEKRKKRYIKMNWLRASLIGTAQGISAFPGISRSGSTISTGIFLGLKGSEAARFSFIISIPAIILANLYSFYYEGFTIGLPWFYYLSGATVAGLFGFVAISFLMMIIEKRRFGWFGLYCFLVSSISYVLYMLGVQGG